MIDGLCVLCGKHYMTTPKFKISYICEDCLRDEEFEMDRPTEMNDYLIWDDRIFCIEPHETNLAVYQYLEYEGVIRKVSHQPIILSDGDYEHIKQKLSLLITLLGAFAVWSNQITANIKLRQSEVLLDQQDSMWDMLDKYLETKFTLYSEVLRKMSKALIFKEVMETVVKIREGVDLYPPVEPLRTISRGSSDDPK